MSDTSARALRIAQGLDSAVDHDLADAIDTAMTSALTIADSLAQRAADLLQIQNARGGMLGEALHIGLNDFTVADLSHVELANIDLQGVYWSVWGTLWPPTTDVEELMRESREVDGGSGRYVIDRGVTSTADASILL